MIKKSGAYVTRIFCCEAHWLPYWSSLAKVSVQPLFPFTFLPLSLSANQIIPWHVHSPAIIIYHCYTLAHNHTWCCRSMSCLRYRTLPLANESRQPTQLRKSRRSLFTLLLDNDLASPFLHLLLIAKWIHKQQTCITISSSLPESVWTTIS